MAKEYRLCEQDVADLAEAIRGEHHDDLEGASIAYVFVDKAPVTQGKLVAGRMIRLSAMLRFLTNFDFVLLLAEDLWQKHNDAQRRATVDHELCHGYMDDEEPQSRHHDLTDFCEVVARHGLVFPEQQRYAEAVRQLELPLALGEKGA